MGTGAWFSGLWHKLTNPSVTFVALADSKRKLELLSRLSDQAAQLDPAFAIYPGDLEARGFTRAAMDQWRDAMDGRLTGDASPNGLFDIVFPVRGNHDRENTSGWQAYFDFRVTADRVGATNFTSMPGEEDLTYSFDHQNARFIGVDVPGNAPRITSAQIEWIRAELEDAENRGLTHAFIYFHGPIYCVGKHCRCTERVCSTARLSKI